VHDSASPLLTAATSSCIIGKINYFFKSPTSSFFFEKPGIYFINNSDGLQLNAYNDTLKRKENNIRVLASFSRPSSSPVAGTVALKLATLPTKNLQRF